MKPMFFFFNDTATTEIYTLSLHDALPIYLAETGTQRLTHCPHPGFGDLYRAPQLRDLIHALDASSAFDRVGDVNELDPGVAGGEVHEHRVRDPVEADGGHTPSRDLEVMQK